MLDPNLLRAQLAHTAERLRATRGIELDVAAIEQLESELAHKEREGLVVVADDERESWTRR